MKGLYKGRYLIAIYDKDEYLIDVVCNPKELKGYKNSNSILPLLSRIQKGIIANKRIHLIDCLEKHNDIFAYEDKLFLDEFDKVNNEYILNKNDNKLKEKINE